MNVDLVPVTDGSIVCNGLDLVAVAESIFTNGSDAFGDGDIGSVAAAAEETRTDFCNAVLYHNFFDIGVAVMPGKVVKAPIVLCLAGTGNGEGIAVQDPGRGIAASVLAPAELIGFVFS